MESLDISQVLGGIPQKIENKLDLIELSRIGLPRNSLLNLAKHLDLSLHQMARTLELKKRVLQKSGPEKPFDPMVSEQILKIAQVVVKGYQVFGAKDRYLAWMSQPNKGLGNKTPLSLLSSQFGIEMVYDELGRIEHGIIS